MFRKRGIKWVWERCRKRIWSEKSRGIDQVIRFVNFDLVVPLASHARVCLDRCRSGIPGGHPSLVKQKYAWGPDKKDLMLDFTKTVTKQAQTHTQIYAIYVIRNVNEAMPQNHVIDRGQPELCCPGINEGSHLKHPNVKVVPVTPTVRKNHTFEF